MQIWTAKYGGFVYSVILNIETYCAGFLLEINGNFKEAYLIWHREMKIICKKYYWCFNLSCRSIKILLPYFLNTLYNIITSLRVEHPVFR